MKNLHPKGWVSTILERLADNPDGIAEWAHETCHMIAAATNNMSDWEAETGICELDDGLGWFGVDYQTDDYEIVTRFVAHFDDENDENGQFHLYDCCSPGSGGLLRLHEDAPEEILVALQNHSILPEPLEDPGANTTTEILRAAAVLYRALMGEPSRWLVLEEMQRVSEAEAVLRRHGLGDALAKLETS